MCVRNTLGLVNPAVSQGSEIEDIMTSLASLNLVQVMTESRLY